LLCARRQRIGVDIELVQPRPTNFAQEFFTAAEQARLNAAPPDLRDLLTTALWSAKEATLKATGYGLTVDPRQVECMLHPARPRHWTPLRVILAPCLRSHVPLRVWWRVVDNRLRPGTNFVLTIAAYGMNL
jgi:phosphopantetheinyl transferase